ncbi:hypothetical protein BGW80DRAFT_1565257 [Lactifluus volemus]|nr:hypothetical protein BGW80DRAFT_1565257 [Lactifluus volemus]
MAKRTHGMTTREKKVDQPPGVVLKRKRRSKEEVERAKEEDAQRKVEKALAEKNKVQRIATLERRIAEEDLDQSTPLAKKPRTLRRTHGHTSIPLPPSEEFEVACVSGDETATETEEKVATVTGTELTDTEQEVNTPMPKKKKGKTDKPSFRAAVQLVNKVSADTEMGIKNKGIGYCETDKATDVNTNMVIDHTPEISDINNCRSRRSLTKAPAKSTPKLRIPARLARARSSFVASPRATTGNNLATTTRTRNSPAVKNVAAISDSEPDRSPSPVALTNEYDTDTNEDRENGYTNAGLGGLDDDDEMHGAEREAAISSPLKGKQRLTSSGIVRVQEVSSLKARPKSLDKDDELPPGATDQDRFRGKFVPTYISWIAQHATDPWKVPNDEMLSVVRKIWAQVYRGTITMDYKIALRCHVVKVTEQRVRDTWRTNFGNNAIVAMKNFFAAQSGEIYDTEIKCRDYAKEMLMNLGFLYSDTTSKKPKKYKGLFRGELVIKTLASSHFQAINGVTQVRGLVLEADQSKAKAAVALSATAVERAFYLLLNDDITIEGLQKSNSRRVKVGRTLNELTGKESTTGTAFSDGNWGDTTRQYLESVEDLNPEALAAILNEALDIFNRPNSRRSKSLAVAQETLGYEPNRRAHLVDLSSCDDDSDADLNP